MLDICGAPLDAVEDVHLEAHKTSSALNKAFLAVSWKRL